MNTHKIEYILREVATKLAKIAIEGKSLVPTAETMMKIGKAIDEIQKDNL